MNTFVSGMFALFLLAGGNAAYAEEPSSVGVGFIGKLTVETACGNLDDLREILRSQNLGAIITEKFASTNQVVVYRAYVALPLYLVPDCVPPGS
ncbi:MAG: hypothetical protein UV20_C0047G0010 [Candidatus Magasanikbacteria bacterium GW2011_GWA2_42_32]|uniref:Uncharacterized protein n=1 Tax=Candidatus Magasanikbacteria bacterium GW2011_GWA2_42_32 TaxID=1619039 RepID=A0A0G0ZYG5_9BACT|nr:MAG: hypothetical protein UV20_C0047G0010 [Candidatus Magasanikbacteria bacterium GW2011_GWA2_42_32]